MRFSARLKKSSKKKAKTRQAHHGPAEPIAAVALCRRICPATIGFTMPLCALTPRSPPVVVCARGFCTSLPSCTVSLPCCLVRSTTRLRADWEETETSTACTEITGRRGEDERRRRRRSRNERGGGGEEHLVVAAAVAGRERGVWWWLLEGRLRRERRKERKEYKETVNQWLIYGGEKENPNGLFDLFWASAF